MGILLAYFLWVTSALAIIVTAWIGVADSGVETVHLRRAATGRSYDAAFMAENGNAPAGTTAAQTAAASERRGGARMPESAAANTRAQLPAERRSGRHVASQLGSSRGAGARVALRANPPPFDGH
jgi:hypothetical protein